MSGDETSAEVIRKIQSRDSKYRAFFVFLMLGVLVALFAVIFLQAQALQEFRNQSAARGAGLKTLSEQNLDAAGRTNSYLQCLARYFAETDRAELQLTDLDACSYERGGNAVPGVDVTPTGTASGDRTTAPSGSTQQTPTTPAPQQETPATAPPEPDPVQVLGVPVCIPFTGVCLR